MIYKLEKKQFWLNCHIILAVSRMSAEIPLYMWFENSINPFL
jgi:hypothetical protein